MAVTAVSLGLANLRVNGDACQSPLSAGSNFRELDDASLQTQTRIWLGEVLQIRLDEERNISDILADGEILFEVAEVLSRVWPATAAEGSHKTVGSCKSTRRYMPYYNVSTFLKLCKGLGLNDIDLFSPSDVVEKRNTRKVCICIRSLSKKVRSPEINVPDFDSVVCTLAMPTKKVGGIRKSLEQSRCSSSLTTPNESVKLRTKTSYQPSDYCDEAVDVESNHPSDYPGSELNGDDNSLLELQLNTGELENEGNRLCEYLSPSVPESVGSLSSVYFSDQDFLASHFSGMNRKMQNEGQNGDINHVPFYWGDFPSDDDDHDHTAYIDDETGLSHDNDNSDSASCDSCPLTTRSCPDIGCETRWNNLVSIGERDSYMCDESFDERSPYSMNENVHNDVIEHNIHPCELINVTHHVSGHAENLDYCSSNDSDYVPEASNEATNASYEAFDLKMLNSDPKEECNDSNARVNLPEMNLNSSDAITTKGNETPSDEGSQNNDDKPVNVEDVEETGHKHHQFANNMEKDVSNEKGIEEEMPQSRTHMTVLKSVAKSTALVAVAVFLLHLRWKNNKGHIPKTKKEPIQVPEKSTRNLPSQNTKKVGNSSCVYPAHKLHFW